MRKEERIRAEVSEEPESQWVHGLVSHCKVFAFHREACGAPWEERWALDRADQQYHGCWARPEPEAPSTDIVNAGGASG